MNDYRAPWRAHISGTALADAVKHTVMTIVKNASSLHIPPIKGMAQVTFKVVDGTEPTLSMSMLVANGHRLVYGGVDTMLSTAAGEVVPLTSDVDDWYLKVLINNENVFTRIDVFAACHECPRSWVRCLSPENVERRNHANVNDNHQDTLRF